MRGKIIVLMEMRAKPTPVKPLTYYCVNENETPRTYETAYNSQPA